jgi:DNA-binding MarR family transcriptional regulator
MALYSQLNDLLQKAGLNEAETIIYSELLKKPAQTLWELIARTGLSKNAVYRSYDKLKSLRIVQKENNYYKALSLKALVAELNASGRKYQRLSNQIKNIAPFLHVPQEAIEEFETLYTKDQIEAAYLFMSEHRYDKNLEFGDYENFVSVLGSITPSIKFRNNRVKHATAHAICTTYGPRTAFFCTKDAKEKFKINVDQLKLDFKGNFIIFSDNNDYILFNNFSESGDKHSILIKSKAVADIQRKQFACFSQLIEK